MLAQWSLREVVWEQQRAWLRHPVASPFMRVLSEADWPCARAIALGQNMSLWCQIWPFRAAKTSSSGLFERFRRQKSGHHGQFCPTAAQCDCPGPAPRRLDAGHRHAVCKAPCCWARASSRSLVISPPMTPIRGRIISARCWGTTLAPFQRKWEHDARLQPRRSCKCTNRAAPLKVR